MNSPGEDRMLNSLRIENFSVQVHLGCEKEERLNTQEVRVTVELRFSELLKGARTDELKDTVCYADLCDAIQKVAQRGEFKLIEKLGLDCFQAVREIAGGNCQMALTIHKVRPPVEGLVGGSIYRLGDFWL